MKRHRMGWLASAAMLMAAPARAGQPTAEAGGKAEKVLYIQGSEVNLRKGPSKENEVAAKVGIGTECREVAGKPVEKGWVKLKCGESEGYTLKTLVASEAPDFDVLLKRAKNSALNPELLTYAELSMQHFKPRGWRSAGGAGFPDTWSPSH